MLEMLGDPIDMLGPFPEKELEGHHLDNRIIGRIELKIGDIGTVIRPGRGSREPGTAPRRLQERSPRHIPALIECGLHLAVRIEGVCLHGRGRQGGEGLAKAAFCGANIEEKAGGGTRGLGHIGQRRNNGPLHFIVCWNGRVNMLVKMTDAAGVEDRRDIVNRRDIDDRGKVTQVRLLPTASGYISKEAVVSGANAPASASGSSSLSVSSVWFVLAVSASAAASVHRATATTALFASEDV